MIKVFVGQSLVHWTRIPLGTWCEAPCPSTPWRIRTESVIQISSQIKLTFFIFHVAPQLIAFWPPLFDISFWDADVDSDRCVLALRVPVSVVYLFTKRRGFSDKKLVALSVWNLTWNLWLLIHGVLRLKTEFINYSIKNLQSWFFSILIKGMYYIMTSLITDSTVPCIVFREKF